MLTITFLKNIIDQFEIAATLSKINIYQVIYCINIEI